MAEYVDTVQATRRRRRPGPLARSEERPFVARLDWVLLAATGGLVAFGLWATSGITQHDVPGDPGYYLTRQFVFAGLGAVLMVAAIFVDPAWYRRWKPALYGVMIGLMVLVALVGTVARGSRRWIDVSFFRFQPSEFGKLLFVLFIAALLADRIRRIEDVRTPLLAIALAVPPVLLVFLQPDLGSGLVYMAALGTCLFVAGIRWVHLGVIAALTLVAVLAALWILPAVGVEVLKPYQTDRLTGFLDPDEDPQGTTWNQRQSITAVGSGGFSGRGVDEATQTRLDYLPEHATDFAFASLSEQRGFVGAAILLLLYLLVVWRGLKIVTIARDAFSAIAAAGIVFALLFQIFINVGMATGVAPVTGITLPFVSVGGSSLVANLLAIGVLEAIAVRGRRRPQL
jgi:rod shape determining protein RodA